MEAMGDMTLADLVSSEQHGVRWGEAALCAVGGGGAVAGCCCHWDCGGRAEVMKN